MKVDNQSVVPAGGNRRSCAARSHSVSDLELNEPWAVSALPARRPTMAVYLLLIFRRSLMVHPFGPRSGVSKLRHRKSRI